MKHGLKIATLLFFISGLVFFVGYQSGYFFPNASEEYGSPVEIETTIEATEIVQDTLKSDSTTSPVKSELAETTRKAPPKKVTLKELSNESLRMYSSKSAPVRIREIHPEKELRMFSSKSLRSTRPYRELIAPRTLTKDNPLKNTIKIQPIRRIESIGPQNRKPGRELNLNQDTLK